MVYWRLAEASALCYRSSATEQRSNLAPLYKESRGFVIQEKGLINEAFAASISPPNQATMVEKASSLNREPWLLFILRRAKNHSDQSQDRTTEALPELC